MKQKTNWRQAQTAGETLKIIQQHSSSNARMGLAFEEVFSYIATRIPELEVKEIYKISEWPEAKEYGLDGRDIGVDRVAILTSGEKVAIQCKCYAEDKDITKMDVRNFLSGSQNKVFDLRWIVTTGNLSSSVERMLKNTNVKHLSFYEFSDVSIDNSRPDIYQPLPLQKEAIDAVIEGFGNPDNNGRGQLIMACGTGKTFTSLKIAEQLVETGGRILFIAPSIALVAQARKEWLRHTSRPMSCTVVCSDQSVGHAESVSTQEFSFSVTTNPKKIATALKQNHGDAISVVFSTYHSLPQIIEAQKKYSAPDFDLALIDEAHRTAGVSVRDYDRVFQLIHKNSNIKCVKRLYMTATPRIYSEKSKNKQLEKNTDLTVTDMSDAEIYGPRFFRLTFRKAVEEDMLCDVRVICLACPEDILDSKTKKYLEQIGHETPGVGSPPQIAEYMSALVIGLALNGWTKGKKKPNIIPKTLPRTLAYANTVRRSKWLAKVLHSKEIKAFLKNYSSQKSKDTTTVDIEAVHLDASSTSSERTRQISKLNSAEGEQVSRIITNCRLFSEGVDVPQLNCVAFMDPKSSEVEIVQSVGRVMRKGKSDKKLGYILVPIALPSDESMMKTLKKEKSRFAILGKVLRALQSHDERLYSQLSSMVLMDAISSKTIEDNLEDQKVKPVVDPDQSEIALDLGLKELNELYTQLADYSGLGNRGKLVADIIIDAVTKTARIFQEEKVAKTLACLSGASEEFLNSLSSKDLEKKLKESTHTASLVICNACMMHKRLEATGNLGQLNKLEEMGSKSDVLSLLIEDWKTILKKDYKPIFEQALDILQGLKKEHRNKVKLQTALYILINCAMDTAESLNDLGYDHAGPLYHKILGNAASQGAFYTKNLSALLMGSLVFDKKTWDWKDQRQIDKLRIIDPCCGTGTLLMAALKTIKDQVTQAQNIKGKEIQSLQKSMIENSIYGLDINSQAIQLAACNLTLGVPDMAYDKINMYTLQYGMVPNEDEIKERNVRQGALELFDQMEIDSLGKNADQDILGLKKLLLPVMGKDANKQSSKLELPNKFDVVMMNPPFTDTSRQKTQFFSKVAKTMGERLKGISNKIKKSSPDAHSALSKKSVGPYFTPLADCLVNDTKGTLAKIIPSTALTSNNGLNERKFKASHFHIETIITSHDPKNIAFSDSTAIHESMMIARRKKNKNYPTRFIQLARMPSSVEEVKSLSEAIQTGNLENWGSCTLWSAKKVQAGDWTPLQWFSSELVEAVECVTQLKGLEKSGERYNWSPGGREFRGNFNYTIGEKKDSKQGNSYCSIAEEYHQCMASPADSFAIPKKGKEQRAKKLLECGGHVLVTERFSTTSNRLFAIFSATPVIGSAFRPIDSIEVIPIDKAKAFVVFLNSTFGVLQFLNRRTKKLTYPKYETGHLKELLLPSQAINLQPLTELYDDICKKELLRLSQAHEDQVRKQLDHAVAKILKVPPVLTDKWRKLLSQEPTITNKRVKGFVKKYDKAS